MELTPAQWEQLKTLFEAALEQDSASRTSFLEHRCPNHEIRSELERLLADYQEMGNFIDGPLLADLAQPLQPLETANFTAGEIVAERFGIVRFIAQGGMGEVYEAEDLELANHVALKVIRPELLRPAFLDQFKNEVQLAKRVTHPNVCRIYDLFRHRRSAETGGDDIFFVSMELLRGETLAQRLRRTRLIRSEEAIRIVVQIAEALAAAHTVGVLHRDVKPANIILVPTADSERVRAVVTDFGLALQTITGGDPQDLGTLAGTPAYMSPEQLRGNQLTPASDIYSLGLVLYRMVTGFALEHEAPTGRASERLSESPRRPSELVPDLDRHCEAVILKCLEPKPSQRYQTARQVIEALGITKDAPVRIFPRQVLYPLIATLAAATIWFGFFGPHGMRTGILQRHARAAILGFRNASGSRDAAWISSALSAFLAADLGAGGRLETISDEEMARAKADLSLTDSEVLPKAALAHIRAAVAVDVLVLGSYRVDEKQVVLNLRVVDIAGGRLIGSIEESGTTVRLFDLLTQAGNRLREKLGMEPLMLHEAEEVRATLPASLDAFQFYASGLEKLQRFDPLAARDQLRQAVKIDPHFPLAHSALAESWAALGYAEGAKAEAKAAFDLSGNLSWRDRQLVEGRYREMNDQLELAADIYRRLQSAYPRELDYGLRLARVQYTAGKSAEALTTVDKLRKLPPPLGDDARIDYTEALAAGFKGDFNREQLAAAKAAAKAAQRGQRQLLAAALRDEGWVLNLSSNRKAVEALSEAKRLYMELGDRGNTARTTLNLATVLGGHASPNARKSMIEEALRTFRSIGNKRGEAVALHNLAGMLQETGRPDEALNIYGQTAAVFSETGDQYSLAKLRNNVGSVLEALGDPVGALREFQASMAIYRALKNKGDIATPLENSATVLLELGDLAGAKRACAEFEAIERDFGSATGAALALMDYADILLAEGRLVPAKKDYQQALGVLKKSDSESEVVKTLDSLSIVALYEGDLAAARKLLEQAMRLRNRTSASDKDSRERLVAARILLEQNEVLEAQKIATLALKDFHDNRDLNDEAGARLFLARCLLSRQNRAEAKAEVERVETFLRKSQNKLIRMDFLITGSRVRAISGEGSDVSDSLKVIDTALRESDKYGLAGFHLEAQLAKGEIELNAGDIAAAMTDLTTARRQAQAMGYGLLDGKARNAQREATNRLSRVSPQ